LLDRVEFPQREGDAQAGLRGESITVVCCHFEALLHFLESYDFGAVDLRTIPKTGAVLDQKIATLPAERGWWLDVLVSGQLPRGREMEVGRKNPLCRSVSGT
jgi:hypothetical protein